MIKIIIADDHGIVRSGLVQLFKMVDDIETVGEASDCESLLCLLEKIKPDIILLDISMPKISGIEIINRIRKRFSKVKILVLSMHNEPQVAVKALEAGANGYLTKDTDPDKLLEAIRKVVDTGRYIDPLMAEQLVFGAISPKLNHVEKKLSLREQEVFNLLVNGKSMNEISESLNISYKTVSAHKHRIKSKLNISSMSELCLLSVQNRNVDAF